jgi:transglutaminase-like putative cysteine protease
VLACLLLPGLASAEGLYLHVIPVEVRAQAHVDFTRPLRLAAYSADPTALARRFGKLGRVAGPDHAVVDLTRYPTDEAPDADRYLGASFVIDFDEAPVTALRAELVAAHGARPSRQALVDFTRAAIRDKTMDRGWDVASRVASGRSGDCTEHAVLLAALARSVGWPARVVTGVVILGHAGELGAYGHAWTELRDAAIWHPADATPIADEQPLAYLPLAELEDEGPGYALKLAASTRTTWIRRIEVLGNSG